MFEFVGRKLDSLLGVERIGGYAVSFTIEPNRLAYKVCKGSGWVTEGSCRGTKLPMPEDYRKETLEHLKCKYGLA